MAEMEIIINKKTWAIRVEGQGYAGGKCLKDADELLEVLGGGKILENKNKPELQKRVVAGRVSVGK